MARTRGLWIALAASAAMLLLLIFILQNGQPSDVHFLGAHGQLPMGVALLLAAVTGALLVTLPILLRTGMRRGLRRRGSTDPATAAGSSNAEPAP
ncbi:lipopolysaccharide assembly protein LapA domain-containing protein [Plantactinospora solaniradicis]|uniref:Lipopolysaccharide assembly protein LapA domain-containing protein n=1 Tax=Plantactinospora solaniradicis TaxID=1723736 RepID=A0ABW1KKZ0_9ACTN